MCSGNAWEFASILALLVNLCYLVSAVVFCVYVSRRSGSAPTEKGSLGSNVSQEREDPTEILPSSKTDNSKHVTGNAIDITSEDLEQAEEKNLNTTSLSVEVPQSNRVEGKIVKCIFSYKADRPTRMSFKKGDLIRCINEKGGWHCGILISSRLPEALTGEALRYPSTFVEPVTVDQDMEENLRLIEEKRNRPKFTTSSRGSSSASLTPGRVTKFEGLDLRVARSTFVSNRPTRLSFAKGDIIQVIDSTGCQLIF